MITNIGIGTAGTSIVDYLRQYSQYNSITFDNRSDIVNLTEQFEYKFSPEDYEKQDIAFDFSTIKDDKVTIFVAAAEFMSAMTLRVIEKLRGKQIKVFLIKSNFFLLSKKKALHEKVIFNVLQEYARSNHFFLYLLDNNKMMPEESIDGIEDVYQNINNVVGYYYHVLNIVSHTKSILGEIEEPLESHKIATIGVTDTKTEQQKQFFQLDNKRTIHYYYIIAKEETKNTKKLFSLVEKHNSKVLENDSVSFSYAVHSMDIANSYILSIEFTPQIQQYKKE